MKVPTPVFIALFFLLATSAGMAGAASDPPPITSDETLFADVIFVASIVVLAGLLARWVAGALHQPAVLGELLMGVVLGNLFYWLGVPIFVIIMHLYDVGQVFLGIWVNGSSVAESVARWQATAGGSAGIGDTLTGALTGPGAQHLVIMSMALWLFSHLGVLFLLFIVGLESSVRELERPD